MAKIKKPPKAARRWARYLRTLGARSWKELTPQEKAAAYERGLRYWQNQEGALPMS